MGAIESAMTEPGRISALMPVYNGARFVVRAIESVLGQTYPDVELVIVNDGSPDNSAEVIRPFLSDRRVRYIEQSNGGVAAARNRALSEASGEFVALIDQDDVWFPDKLSRQVPLLMGRLDIALVHCRALPIDQDDRSLQPHAWRAGVSPFPAYVELFMSNTVKACTAVFRRDVAIAVGGFDTSRDINFADEYDLWLRIAREHDVAYDDAVLAYYRLHDANNSANKAVMVRAALAVVRKALRTHTEARARIGDARIGERFARLHLALYRAHSRERQRAFAWIEWLRAFMHSPRIAIWLSLSTSEQGRLLWYRRRLRDLVKRPRHDRKV